MTGHVSLVALEEGDGLMEEVAGGRDFQGGEEVVSLNID